MALTQYRIRAFSGLNQSASENGIDPGESPDARNMDTDDGRLTVAKGYVALPGAAHPAPASVRRILPCSTGGTEGFLAVTGVGIDFLPTGGASWQRVHTFASPLSEGVIPDWLTLRIGAAESVLVATGEGQMVRWNGQQASLFGSAAQLSDAPWHWIELYFNRLFAAGDPAHPSRLCWSAAPGDNRTVEDFTQSPASENVSGGYVEIGADSDPITGLTALTNQLVIFKRDSIYRLLGDRPGNFRISRVSASMAQAAQAACVTHRDAIYYLTGAGLCCFDGQTARRMANADKVRTFLSGAELSGCTAACCGDKLVFAVRTAQAGANDALLVYDVLRGTYQVRDGFTLRDLACARGTLYLMDGLGRLCRFGEGTDYAGTPIHAYWCTPDTDLDAKVAEKRLRELYLRGSGGVISVAAFAGGQTVFFERLMPEGLRHILEVPLTGGGRAFSLRLANEGGSAFTVDGGLELLIDVQRRVL